MARKGRQGPSADVKRLGELIEHWRRTRERRTAMPAKLWSGAIALGRREGAYPIARALRINFEGLKRRMAEAATTVAPAPPSAFVELSGAEILDAGPAPGTVVELSDKDGICLTVRLAAAAEIDLVRLVSAFRQRTP